MPEEVQKFLASRLEKRVHAFVKKGFEGLKTYCTYKHLKFKARLNKWGEGDKRGSIKHFDQLYRKDAQVSLSMVQLDFQPESMVVAEEVEPGFFSHQRKKKKWTNEKKKAKSKPVFNRNAIQEELLGEEEPINAPFQRSNAKEVIDEVNSQIGQVVENINLLQQRKSQLHTGRSHYSKTIPQATIDLTDQKQRDLSPGMDFSHPPQSLETILSQIQPASSFRK